MVVDNVLHMNGGDGETSYANYSHFQKSIISTTRAAVEDTIRDMVKKTPLFDHCYTIADLGCGWGPNNFFAISNIIDSIFEQSHKTNKQPPHELQIFLNDLPGNDFNSIFKYTPSFYKKIEEEHSSEISCLLSGVPGSFYQWIFPRNSLNLVHSSSSLHWLTQVPQELEDNRRNIYISKSSPASVFPAYLKQFQKDFGRFLSSRAEEIVPGGRMILIFGGKRGVDPLSCDRYVNIQLKADTLLEMAAEGLVKESHIDSFNMPYYLPGKEEVMNLIQEEGSFNIYILEAKEIRADVEGNREIEILRHY